MVNETEILNTIKDAALSLMGCGYIWGATGWVSSPKRRLLQAHQYPAHEKTILGLCKKWDGKRCFDCAQLTRFAAAAGGVSLPSGATSQWMRGSFRKKGEIQDMPAIPCLVFIKSGTGMRHVGLSLGDRTVVHAKSSACGVVLEPLSKGKWTHYALLSLDGMMRTSAPSGTTVNLREQPTKTSALLARIPLGNFVTVTGVHGAWASVRYLEHEGYVMKKFLTEE